MVGNMLERKSYGFTCGACGIYYPSFQQAYENLYPLTENTSAVRYRCESCGSGETPVPQN